MDLIIVRHGQSEYNVRRTRDMDSHLSVEGYRQVEETASWLARHMKLDGRFGIVSPFRRTCQTARVIAKETGLKFRVYPLVHEFMVTYENFQIQNHRESFPEFDWSGMDSTVSFPMERESMDAYRNRMAKVLNWLMEDHGGKPLLVVSHGLPCDTLARLAIGADERPETFTVLQNCSVTWITGKHTLFFGRTFY